MSLDLGVPSFEQFKITIEGMMGNSLTCPALEVVHDFYDNWHSFNGLISNRQISIQVDPLSLAHHYPQYRRYQIWTGGALFLVLIGLVLIALWFFWQVGLPLLIGAMVMYLMSKHIMHKDTKHFAEELMNDAALRHSDGGFAKLCASYITGIIHISSPLYTAHWPQHPSNAITGQRTFIETNMAKSS